MRIGLVQNVSGELIMESKEKRDELNKHFPSIFTTQDTNDISEVIENWEGGRNWENKSSWQRY